LLGCGRATVADLPSAPEVARRLADALEAASVPYAVGGALAYGLHAPPRATNDVDLNVFVAPAALDPVFDALERAGAVVSREAAKTRAAERGDFSVTVDGIFRAKDVSDVERLVTFQGAALDRAYVRRWLVDLVGPDDERIGAWDALVVRAG
jgi:hypothetical protein